MKPDQLLKKLHYRISGPEKEMKANAVTLDSRQVTQGSFYIALKPLNGQSGIPNILEAIHKGARYILKDQDVKIDSLPSGASGNNVTFIDVDNARIARTQIAANLYPKQPDKVVAVTGTNGKTSTVTFLRQIWDLCGHKSASMGSLGIQANVPLDNMAQSYFATPDPFVLHENMYKLAMRQVTHLALEASSQGLDQYRLESTQLTAAAYTNLSHEHLDYHGSMEQYFEAKCRLFAEVLPENAAAVLNADDFRFRKLYDICRSRGHNILTFGREAKEIKLVDATVQEKGQTLTLKIYDRAYHATVPLIGLIQGYNIMAAIGLAIACGQEPDQLVSVLPQLKSANGRFDKIGEHPGGGKVYVDYAHKPKALEMVLTSLRPHVKGRLWLIFGCGGDRDKQKRLMMGEIAAQHADKVIVTDDNPRYENAADIRQQVLKGCPAALEIADRRLAIRHVLQQLEKNDACIIAGKGHEQGQIIGDQVIPFDDRKVAREELGRLGGKSSG